MLHSIKTILLNLFFTPRCQSCDTLLPLKKSGLLCRGCASRIRWIEDRCQIGNAGETFHFDKAYACAAYDGPVKRLLKRYKFKQKVSIEPFLNESLRRLVAARLSQEAFDAVISVPSDPQRGFVRGINPASRLAGRLAKSLGLPDASPIVKRRSAPCQSLLPKTKRQTNVRDVFYLEQASVPFRHILLVDDILTSGHTASACARVLKENGAATVTALTFARA